MYSDKKNVLQLIALLKAYQIRHIVLCPGSRNSPLNHSFSQDKWFTCYSVTDERSAGFFALGIIQQSREPVAVCCTSGSAVLNLAPAVAEAYYQALPLLVISADRPAAWVGQMDGQTLPQPGVFNTLVRKSVQLPEPGNPEEEWYCNRLINEALLSLSGHGKGPVQINIPLSEPLFQYTVENLPEARKINRCLSQPFFREQNIADSYLNRLRKFKRPLLIIGQHLPENELAPWLKRLKEQQDCLIFAEYLANVNIPEVTAFFDPVLYCLPEEKKKELAPDLVITLGGHIVSKRLKQWIRSNPPKEHWHISEAGEIADLFQSLTEVIESDSLSFIKELVTDDNTLRAEKKMYQPVWEEYATSYQPSEPAWSDLHAVSQLCKSIPENSSLHLANSSSVRYAQLFGLPQSTHIFCNRGTNGIEGSVSTAVGYSTASERLTFLLTGDLSFFYDMNGLWNQHISPNLRILLNNNNGGEIFYALPGLNRSEALNPYIAGNHHQSAAAWAESAGFLYLQATNEKELKENMAIFVSSASQGPILLEVFSNIENNTEILRKQFKQLTMHN